MNDGRPKIVMKGSVGLLTSVLRSEQLALLEKRLTVESIPFKNEDPIVVKAYSYDNGYFWIPRYFDYREFWPKIHRWEWVAPTINYKFEQRMKPDPKRKQPEAIAAMVDQLKDHSGGICILPTGTGKTMCAYTIASKFSTPIGVLIYKGDMIDNWIEHAESVLGVPPSDVGIVKESRCDLGKPVTIISIQTALSRGLPRELLDHIGLIISDECHHYASRVWGTVISLFPARYRLALSADPTRDDGLDPIIRWNFGKVGYSLHKRPTGEKPLVCLVRVPVDYDERKYHDWERVWDPREMRNKWVMTTPNAMKYYKQLLRDRRRNEWLVSQLIKARSSGRRILIFSHLRDHVDILHEAFKLEWKKLSSEQVGNLPTRIACLWGGLKDHERRRAMQADVIFTTHGFSRDALNLTHIDTLVFATPPGNPLQPVGRLRDKGDPDRKPLLVIDPFEIGDYSFRKVSRRKQSYNALGISVKRINAKL